MVNKYLLLVALITSLIFSLSVKFFGLKLIDSFSIIQLNLAKSKFVIIGNSALTATSKCDTDTSSVAKIIANNSVYKMSDLSRGGLQLSESLAIASLHWSDKNKIFLVQVDVPDILNGRLPDLNGPTGWLKKQFSLISKSPLIDDLEDLRMQSLSYKGRFYGAYSDYSSKEFAKERKVSTCPEKKGQDQDFIEFMYWKFFVRGNNETLTNASNFYDYLNRISLHGDKYILWIQPFNYQYVKILFGSEVLANVENKIHMFESDLNKHNIQYVDLSEQVSEAGFTDVWCACGHMNQDGRQIVANKIKSLMETLN